MKIEQKYVVGPHIFDTEAQAQAHIDESVDQQRIDAFCEHLRATGTKRLARIIPDTIEDFIKFENGYYDTSEGQAELNQKTSTESDQDDDEEEDDVDTSSFANPVLVEDLVEDVVDQVIAADTPTPPSKSLFGA